MNTFICTPHSSYAVAHCHLHADVVNSSYFTKEKFSDEVTPGERLSRKCHSFTTRISCIGLLNLSLGVNVTVKCTSSGYSKLDVMKLKS
jgi:hypothetical protein